MKQRKYYKQLQQRCGWALPYELTNVGRFDTAVYFRVIFYRELKLLHLSGLIELHY